MDRDYFITWVYCLVADYCKSIVTQYGLRHGGFAPALSDAEVITMEICGEHFKLETDKDIFAYFHTHYRHFFPKLTDRTLFVRQSANLWRLKAIIQRRITLDSGQAQDHVQSIDTLPLPVCGLTRAHRDRCFKPVADYGYCAAKDMRYYGFKLGLRISRAGMILNFPLLPARPHDVTALSTLVEGFGGLAPADKGFIDAYQQQLLAERQGVQVVTPPRANMKAEHTPKLLKACAHWRKLIETVGSHLTERFSIARIRVHDLWHFQLRIIRKVLAHTMAVFLNLQLGREPLDLDGLVSD